MLLSGSTVRVDLLAHQGVAASIIADVELSILSSTIAENTVDEGEGGGGILNANGHLTVTNSTIVGNRAVSFVFQHLFGGGIINLDQLEIQNTIIALNSARVAPDCSGSPLSLGSNIIGDTSGCRIILRQTDLPGDPGLGDLVVEDPPGRGYYPLLADSPAIDAANPDACPATDQLGLPRLGNCDIGSVEFQGGIMVVSVDIIPKKTPTESTRAVIKLLMWQFSVAMALMPQPLIRLRSVLVRRALRRLLSMFA